MRCDSREHVFHTSGLELLRSCDLVFPADHVATSDSDVTQPGSGESWMKDFDEICSLST